jgi:hypothetical protein
VKGFALQAQAIPLFSFRCTLYSDLIVFSFLVYEKETNLALPLP